MNAVSAAAAADAASEHMTPFRISTLKEREEFYSQEFDCRSLEEWFRGRRWPQFFVVDAGTESRIAIDPSLLDQLLVLRPGLGSHEVASKLVQYIPEDVYYDTIEYPDAQRARRCPQHQPVCTDQTHGNWKSGELVFDIDSENIDCPRCGKGRNRFCALCIRTACENADALAAVLEREYDFHDIRFVYSGRGVHVHVDDAAARMLSMRQRAGVAQKMLHFAIDPWVTESKRLIRLPYSLHGLVSRIAVPLERKELRSFDPVDDARALPGFLRE